MMLSIFQAGPSLQYDQNPLECAFGNPGSELVEAMISMRDDFITDRCCGMRRTIVSQPQALKKPWHRTKDIK